MTIGVLQTGRRLAVWGLLGILLACSDGTDPGPVTTDPAGLWDVSVSNIVEPVGRELLNCQVSWVMSILSPEVTGAGAGTYSTIVPYNVIAFCSGGVTQPWTQRARFYLIRRSGDSLAFIRPSGDTVVLATVSGNRTMSGEFKRVQAGPSSEFRATRRSDTTDPNLSPASLMVAGPYADVEVGDSIPIVASVLDAYGAPVSASVTWSSSTPSVASIEANGVVHGVTPGVATIAGSVDALSATVDLTVLQPPASVRIVMSPDSVIAPLTDEVTAEARDAAGQVLSGRRFHWTSSNSSVATVTEYDEKTTVTPAGAGTVTITARSGAASASASVRILPAVAEILISGSDGRILLGNTVQLAAETRDAAGQRLLGRPVSWVSGDQGIVAVTQAGMATALRATPTPITASAEGASQSLIVTGTMDAPLTTVTAGFGHTCGLSQAGTVYCWGHNDGGRLGLDQTGGPPVRVPIPVTFTSLEAGGLHTCGLTAAGAAWCWGVNGSGQLGQSGGTPGDIVQVSGGHSFTRIEPGDAETCALTSAQAAWCWGANEFGQLGRGTSDIDVNPSPAQVVGGHRFTDVQVGSSYACGITIDAEAWCWGSNEFGEFGLGSADPQPHGTPVHAATGLTFTALALGGTRVCGVSTGGSVWCWGNRQFSPEQVPGIGGIVTVTAGSDHFCGIDAAGTMTCWGTTDVFNLAFAPSVPIAGITAGLLHTCALPKVGKSLCWGLNDGGQLGIGADTLGPVEVAGQP